MGRSQCPAGSGLWPDHRHPAAGERTAARRSTAGNPQGSACTHTGSSVAITHKNYSITNSNKIKIAFADTVLYFADKSFAGYHAGATSFP